MHCAAPAEAEDEGFRWTVLPRHGRRPLGFTGRMLFRSHNGYPGLAVRSEIGVFETRDGRFVATIHHSSAPPGLFLYDDARLCAVAADVHAMFADHAPDVLLPLEVLLPAWQVTAAQRAAPYGEAALQSCERHLSEVRRNWQILLAAAFGKYAVQRDESRHGHRVHHPFIQPHQNGDGAEGSPRDYQAPSVVS